MTYTNDHISHNLKYQMSTYVIMSLAC
jgi:hypothetical protein